MSAFRTCRPLYVEAEQCTQSRTITTDTGFRHVNKGEWIIKGEDGECYVVDDPFFKRTFSPIQSYPWEVANQEGRSYGC